MRVVIAGGHGNVALRLTRRLSERGDEIRSIIRRAEHADDVRAAGAEPVVCDVESADPDAVAAAAGPADAIVFAAGAGPGSGPERKRTMDYGGAVKLVLAARELGIGRYVMLSSVGANPSLEGEDTFTVYLRAKGQADAELMASGLDYVIVRPGRLTDDPGTGRVRIGRSLGDGEISRDDVAAVLAASVHEPAAEGCVFEVLAGDVAVEEAVASCARAAGAP